MAEEAEGVVGSTWEEFKAHPYIIAGAVGVVVILLWYNSRAKPGATPQQFAFSYGPSDAQVQAGTQLAIAQQADQTALSVATLQSGIAGQQITADSAAATDYFGYLTGANNNSLAALKDSNAAGIATNAANNNALITTTESNNATTINDTFNTTLLNNQTAQMALLLKQQIDNNLISNGLGGSVPG